MISLTTNISSIMVQNNMKTSTNKLNCIIEQMTTGFKINHAKDNAANYVINSNMSAKLSSYHIAEENAMMGIDLLSTANSALSNISDQFVRIRALAMQANNGTYNTSSLDAINSEVNALVDEIARCYTTTEYNGLKLFGTTDTTSTFSNFALPRNNIDENKRVSNVTSFTSGDTYYISDSSDLIALQDLVNSGKSTNNVNFELTTSIDMAGVDFRGIGTSSSYAFKGSFNGNYNTIMNLEISENQNCVGLFGYTENAELSNICLKNCNISGLQDVGGLVGHAEYTDITHVAIYDATIYSTDCGGTVAGRIVYSTLTESCGTGSVSGNVIGGLVGYINKDTSIVKNCYFNGSVNGSGKAGGFAAQSNSGKISNCYASGTVSGGSQVGGFIGNLTTSAKIENCFTTCDVSGTSDVGGFIGYTAWSCTFNQNYASGSVSGTSSVGGFIGYDYTGNSTGSNNAYNTASASVGTGYRPSLTTDAMTLTEISNKYTDSYMGFTSANGWTTSKGKLKLAWENLITSNINSNTNITPTVSGDYILQLGINGDWASRVGFDIKIDLSTIDELRGIGVDLTTDFLSKIDTLLGSVSDKQTELGAIENRLESAIESIATQQSTLTSSRSTIRDTDIAEISSEYVQQQILQQAASTLLATANQTPAIALQLI